MKQQLAMGNGRAIRKEKKRIHRLSKMEGARLGTRSKKIREKVNCSDGKGQQLPTSWNWRTSNSDGRGGNRKTHTGRRGK